MKSRLVLLACCLALLSSCGQGDKSTGKAPEFAVITVETTTANLTNSYPATIKGKQDVEIRPMVSGFITKLHVDEGSVVRKGQVLFSIDPVQYQAAVNSAKAAVETAKAAVNTQELTVSNKRTLNQKNIISDYDLQMAENQLAQTKAQLAQAEAQLVNAQNNLSYTNVTSPSDGIVGTIPYRVGSLVSPSMATPLTTVADISEMFAYFSMTERQLLSLIREGSQDKAAHRPALPTAAAMAPSTQQAGQQPTALFFALLVLGILQIFDLAGDMHFPRANRKLADLHSLPTDGQIPQRSLQRCAQFITAHNTGHTGHRQPGAVFQRQGMGARRSRQVGLLGGMFPNRVRAGQFWHGGFLRQQLLLTLYHMPHTARLELPRPGFSQPSRISNSSRATSLPLGSSIESTRTLTGRLPKVISITSPIFTA